MIINFLRDDNVVASISNVEALNTIAGHSRGFKFVEREQANPLLFNLNMTTIRKLTMKSVLFDVTAYILNNNRVIQIISMEAGKRKEYITEPSNQIIEVPSDLNLDIMMGDTVSIVESGEGE